LYVFSVGMVGTYVQKGLELKKKAGALIVDKLCKPLVGVALHYILLTTLTGETANTRVSRMFYANFDEHITEKLGVVLENWPLKKFCSPSDIGSQAELNVLIQAFESGSTRFRRLTTAELSDWREQRFQNALARGGHGDGEGAGDGSVNAEVGSGMEGMEGSVPSNEPGPVFLITSTASSQPTGSACQDGNATTSRSDSQGQQRAPFVDTINTVNSVTSSDGHFVTIAKKPRKTRSDKGQKRPRKANGGAAAA
jgi:hypothetical protein